MRKNQTQWSFWVIFRHLNNRICRAFVAFFVANQTNLLRRFALFGFALFIAPNALNAYNFSKCKEFYLNASQIFTLEGGKEIRAIHIGDGKYLAYGGTSFSESKGKDLLKYDGFTGLMLFSGKKIVPKYDLIPITQSAKNMPLAAITDNTITQGKILRQQLSLKNKATFSRQIPPNAVISDICYQSYGLSAGSDKFIDIVYITRFLSENGVKIYSDIGFEIKAQKGALIISYVNPFVKFMLLDSGSNQKNATNQKSTNLANQKSINATDSLKIGDEIVAINDTTLKNENDFFDTAATLPLGKKATIRVKRGDRILNFAFLPMKRVRGFDENGTMLDFFGIVIDDSLRVIRAPRASIFRANDRILRLNQIIIENKTELDSAILRVLREKWDFSFLITRKDFEFFITFKNEDK